MSFSTLQVMALANFVLCGAAGAICLCRLVRMGADTSARFIARYALLFTAATTSGFQPLLFGEWPGAADLTVGFALMVFLATSARAWRGGAPPYARKPARDEYLRSTVWGLK